MKTYPAIDVRTDDADMLAALVDDFSPAALEQRDDVVRVFFATARDRDAAQHALASQFDVAAIDVPDEDWAARSQADLKPVVVGRITIVPSSKSGVASQSQVASPQSRVPSRKSPAPSPEPAAPTPVTIVIQPSMGFGTGHHATTRLCLAALQARNLDGCSMLDVGTGSGVLAIAAAVLGAARAIGIDCDADAIESARENLQLNPGAAGAVSFEVIDFADAALDRADIVTANLTGALLVRSAPRLLDAVRPGGTLILSGILAAERDEVASAVAPAAIAWEQHEDGWVGLAVKK